MPDPEVRYSPPDEPVVPLKDTVKMREKRVENRRRWQPRTCGAYYGPKGTR